MRRWRPDQLGAHRVDSSWGIKMHALAAIIPGAYAPQCAAQGALAAVHNVRRRVSQQELLVMKNTFQVRWLCELALLCLGRTRRQRCASVASAMSTERALGCSI